jgi:hypothetical protein
VSDLKGYFAYLTAESRIRYDAGMTPLQAARDIDLTPYKGWGESERVVANVHALYREFGSSGPEGVDVLRDMATLAQPA